MLGTLCTWAVALIFLGYLVPHLIVAFFYKTKNLKKAYNAQWALVTGASSGEAGRRAWWPRRRDACTLYAAVPGTRALGAWAAAHRV